MDGEPAAGAAARPPPQKARGATREGGCRKEGTEERAHREIERGSRASKDEAAWRLDGGGGGTQNDENEDTRRGSPDVCLGE